MDILNSNTKRSSLEPGKFPTDLVHSFLPTSPNTTLRHHVRHHSPENQEHGEELNLGLSLGGRFGVDKSHKGLVRSSSSSVTDSMPLSGAEEAAALVRTASLPPETEEEWRKRKELQSLRRMEAKRKRSDKQNLNPGRPGKSNSGSGYPKQQKQGSIESQGGSKSSSNASESERNTIQAEVSSRKELNSLDNEKKARGGENGIGNMPCVFTIGDGPRGRKVEGILYRYKKGEEVRIMCICHGSFFTPAEFVNHAGAHNVAHPLKRIVVNPNASPFS